MHVNYQEEVNNFKFSPLSYCRALKNDIQDLVYKEMG
jgi:hypothetical protein